MDASQSSTNDGAAEVEDGFSQLKKAKDIGKIDENSDRSEWERSNRDAMKASNSIILGRLKNLEREYETKTKELEQRLREAERNLGISPLSSLTPWRFSSTGAGPAGSPHDTNINMMETETFKLTPDMYSVLSTWEWNTKPFWASLFVVFLQITLLSVLIVDLIGGAEVGNVLNLPGNVEYTVRIAQAVAVPIVVFKQEDLRQGIEGIFQGMPHAFRGDIKFQYMTPMKWRFGYFLRFGQGFLSMWASFILIMQAETVFDLLLNFLGIEFISDLDNLAFRLAGLGYFGITTRDCVNTVAEAEFRKDETDTEIQVATFSPNWCRIYAHILGVFFIFIAIVSSFIYYAAQQYDGEYLPRIVQVEFGDETLPYVGIFNGCYMARTDGTIAERFVFEQMGRSTLQGRLAYCSNLYDGVWVLFHDGDDPCENPIVSSGSTKTFDVLETVESQWYTNKGLPLEYIQIYQVDDESGFCGSLDLLEATQDSCSEIELDLDGRSTTFQKRQLLPSSEGKVLDAIRSHPVYVSADGSESEVVIFTGRRWVLLNSTKISSWENTTTLLDDAGNEEFYKGLMNVGSEWILSISEPVDGLNDQGTPLGLQWYFPRDIGEDLNSTADFNFYLPDLTRPVGLACASCNSKTNPCLYEGVCNDKTGKCECKHGASGKLCRDLPFGDGTCNTYFNKLDYGYDSGDCCASTCRVSSCEDSRIALPFGLDVLGKKGNESRAVWFGPLIGPLIGVEPSTKAFGYDECRDPNQASFVVETKPTLWKVVEGSRFEDVLFGIDADFDWRSSLVCTIENFFLTCDDKPYMEIASILEAITGDVDECPIYRQTFQVPYGASCEMSYTNNLPLLGIQGMIVTLLDGSDGEPIYEDFSPGVGVVNNFRWKIPAAKCITQAFSNASKSIFDTRTLESNVVNRLATSMRAIDWCESGESDILLERFALEALLMMLGSIESYRGEVNHCNVPVVGEGFSATCNKDNRVTILQIESDFYTPNATLLDFIDVMQLLPKMQSLGIVGRVLSGPIPIRELAVVPSLTTLQLINGALTGTIPTEIASMPKLQFVAFVNNTLTGTIPTEFGILTELATLQLGGNDLTGPAIPSELFSLQLLDTYIVSNNRLSGSIPSEVGLLERLIQLDLNGNLLTGTIPTQIGDLEALIVLTLSNNLLSGTIPIEVENLSKLIICDILSGNANMTGEGVGFCT